MAKNTADSLITSIKGLHEKRFFLTSYGSLFAGRDSSVGIATRYRLEGPVIESRWRRDSPHPSIPALGPTHLPIQLVPGLSQG
jgi:hypothetical protein